MCAPLILFIRSVAYSTPSRPLSPGVCTGSAGIEWSSLIFASQNASKSAGRGMTGRNFSGAIAAPTTRGGPSAGPEIST